MRLLQSRLAAEFVCLAKDCPSTCCRDWDIIWHESEVEKLCASDNNFILNKIPTSFSIQDQYRLIKLDEKDRCPFLTGEGLCEIHKELGEEYLSYVCKEYPRISRICDDVILSSCRTSCYAVVDHICRYSDSMDLIVSDISDTTAIISTSDDGKRRLRIFDNKRAASLYSNSDISSIFYKIFGWEIITAKTDIEKERAEAALKEYCCEEFEDNLIKAVFLEWLINNFYTEASDEDNLRCFDFCVGAIRLAVVGAAGVAENREQFICTICDFISFLLSNAKKIIMYFNYVFITK